MKKVLDIDSWNRKAIYKHFMQLKDPFFGVVVDVDVTEAFKYAKENKKSFFAVYLHACLKAINDTQNFRLRLEDDKVFDYGVIHASATIAREDNTYGFSFIKFDKDLKQFENNYQKEKERILNTTDLYPPFNSKDCIHCSALPWFKFSGHKEPVSGLEESIPKLGFGMYFEENAKKMMSISINVHHALVDGYHVGLFLNRFQNYLNKID